jgi:DNA-binding GntR family transcriptional regulator
MLVLYGQSVPPALYQSIRAQLEARIQSGALPPGSRLPTEAELQHEHGVSRATAQRVLNELAQAGLAVRSRGRGTHVADGAQLVNLVRYLNPQLGDAGIPGTHRILSASVVPAAKALVELPGVDDDAAVNQLVRLKYNATDEPIAIEAQAIPFALAPSLLDEDLAHLTTHGYFTEKEVPLSRTRMYVDPVNIDPGNAELLEIESGLAVIRWRRLTWLANGGLAESAAIYLRPGMNEFYVEYTTPSP